MATLDVGGLVLGLAGSWAGALTRLANQRAQHRHRRAGRGQPRQHSARGGHIRQRGEAADEQPEHKRGQQNDGGMQGQERRLRFRAAPAGLRRRRCHLGHAGTITPNMPLTSINRTS